MHTESGHTVSNDTRVRMDGFVKIMARLLPANGLYDWSSALILALTTLAVSSMASSCSLEKSSMCRKWWPRVGGATLPAVK